MEISRLVSWFGLLSVVFKCYWEVICFEVIYIRKFVIVLFLFSWLGFLGRERRGTFYVF